MCFPWVLRAQGLGWVPHGSGTQYSGQTCFMVVSWSGAWEAELSTWLRGMGNTNGHEGEPGTPPQRLAEDGGCLPWSPRSCPPPLQAAAPTLTPPRSCHRLPGVGRDEWAPFPCQTQPPKCPPHGPEALSNPLTVAGLAPASGHVASASGHVASACRELCGHLPCGLTPAQQDPVP